MSTDRSVFSFRLSDLSQVFGRREENKKRKEEEFLRGKFSDWDLKENDKLDLTSSTLAAIITDPKSTRSLVDWGEKLGAIFKSLQLSTSQIRNIFSTVRQIEMSWVKDDEEERTSAINRLLLLKPKLAYQASREKAVTGLADVLSEAINSVDSREDLERFVNFFEAILAYHTAAGGQ
jgi:CRISPR-associated protein Csm2